MTEEDEGGSTVVPALGHRGVSKPFALVGQALGSGCPLTFTNKRVL